jgi:hypothetical protein
MQHNVGTTDKIIRVAIGMLIIGAGVYFKSWWGLLGLIPLLTASISFCPLYSLFKMRTNKDQ